MDNIKISVTFQLPGSVMDTVKNERGELINTTPVVMKLYDKKKDKVESLTIRVAGCKPCMQSINMTEEAYQAMMDTPATGTLSHWKRMSENQRIIEHLKLIQYDLHATDFEFTIYDD